MSILFMIKVEFEFAVIYFYISYLNIMKQRDRMHYPVWRLTTRHKDYEEIVSKALEKFKAGIRKEIYTLTQNKHAVSN